MVLETKLVNFVIVKYKHAHLPYPTFYNVYPTGSVNQQITEGVASIYDTDSNKKLLSELRTAANTTFAAQTIRTIEEI
jgi:hypothetical protein